MSRLKKTFNNLKKKNQKALIPFITAGDPSLKETAHLILTLEKAGADIIELGVPFSDPMADGPVIQLASERALKRGVTLDKILDLVRDVRQKTQIPLLLMGYFNPIFVMGIEKFAKNASASGVDAVLIVDLPPEEALETKKILRKNKIDLVFLLAPTSDESRIDKAVRLASGFLYYVSITGITGAKLNVNVELNSQVKRIQGKTKIPVCVGFGIKKPDQAKAISKIADGVVVGSSLVALIDAFKSKHLHMKVEKYISSLKKAIS